MNTEDYIKMVQQAAEGLYNLGKAAEGNNDFAKALDNYEKAAKLNNKEAMLALGDLYRYGRGVNKDIAKAIEWLELAANLDSEEAMVKLSEIYTAQKNYSKAIEWLQKADSKSKLDDFLQECGAEEFQTPTVTSDTYTQDSGAILDEAMKYYKGDGVAQNYTKARKLFEEAAKFGNTDAMDYLGIMYRKGLGVKKDNKKALKYFEQAAEQDNPYALFDIGFMYEKGYGVNKSPKKASEFYERAVDLNNTAAMNNLARLYISGQGVYLNEKKAIKLYEMAANLNDSYSMYQLGKIYEAGKIVPQNKELALQWYQKAAALGNDKAKNNVEELNAIINTDNKKVAEELYQKGKSYYDAKNYEEALQLFEKAAELGDNYAMYNLGYMYQFGNGVELDYTKAVEWYQKAADLGDETANKNLEILNEEINTNGLPEIDFDVKAFKYRVDNLSTYYYDIKDLVRAIFKEVYGIGLDELNGNPLEDSMNEALKEVRASYTDNVCETNYSKEANRQIYMIAYYPYYIVPAYQIMTKYVVPLLKKQKGYLPTLRLKYLAGGPVPELFGTALALSENNICDNVKVEVYDTEPGWFQQQKITRALCKPLINISDFKLISNFDFSKIAAGTDIFVMQNLLSHIGSKDDIKDICRQIISSTFGKTIFIFIDFNYPHIKLALSEICQRDFLNKVNASLIYDHTNETAIARHSDPPQELLNKVFTGQGCIPRRNNKYYYVVIQSNEPYIPF